MRTELATFGTGLIGTHTGFNPWSGSFSEQLTGDKQVRTVLSRSDVQKGTVVNGWRYPLPYQADVDQPGQLRHAISLQGKQYVGAAKPRVDRYDGYLSSSVYNVDPSLLLPITAAMRSQGIAKLRKKLNDNKIELGVALLEGREAVSMIAKAIITLARFIDALRSRNFVEAARVLGVSRATVRNGASLSEAWLAFQFGWKPLVEDIMAYSATLSSLSDVALIRASVKVQRDDMSEESVLWTPSVEYYGRVDTTIQRYWLFLSTYQISCYLGLENGFFRDLNRLGLVNLPSMVWATTPWSFVLDWAVGIGDIIAGLSADVGLTFISGSESFYQEGRSHDEVKKATFVAQAGQYMDFASVDPLPLPARTVRFRRKVLTDVPMSFVPYIKNPFDTFKVTTSVALLNQQRLK